MNHISKLALLSCVLGLAACDNLRDGGGSNRVEPPALPDATTASDDFLRDFAVTGGAGIGYLPGITHHLNSFRTEAGETKLVQFMAAGEDGAGVLEVHSLDDASATPVRTVMGTPVDANPAAAYSGVLLSNHQVGDGAVIEDRGSFSVVLDSQTGLMDVNGVTGSMDVKDDSYVRLAGKGAFVGSDFASGDIRYELFDAGTATGVEATGSMTGLLAENGDTPALVGTLDGSGGMTISGAFVAVAAEQ